MRDAVPASSLLAAAREAALLAAGDAASSPVAGLAHRELMRRVKTLVSVAVSASVSPASSPEAAPPGTVVALRALLGELTSVEGG